MSEKFALASLIRSLCLTLLKRFLTIERLDRKNSFMR
jgi:hypothetical protein